MPDEAVVTELCRLKGIGRWSAEYAMLRGLGRLHVFPGDDVGARNNLHRRLGLTEKLDYESVAQVLRRWQPFKGLIYFHLYSTSWQRQDMCGGKSHPELSGRVEIA